SHQRLRKCPGEMPVHQIIIRCTVARRSTGGFTITYGTTTRKIIRGMATRWCGTSTDTLPLGTVGGIRRISFVADGINNVLKVRLFWIAFQLSGRVDRTLRRFLIARQGRRIRRSMRCHTTAGEQATIASCIQH
ncbi:hypothetical protein PIB30_106524, partial [Stylosanthes scabra]|nr:hypothetical protein [Stylosanthes scabra]